MERKIEEKNLIRRYLLGQLTEDELQQLEKRMMTDSELFNRLLLAEDEMVDEYVEDRLPERDRELFEASFLATADGREQVSFARSLRKYVSAAAAESPDKVIKGHQPFWRKHPAFGSYVRLAAAAVVLLGIGLGIWRVFFYQSEVSKGMAALAQAYRERRPLEARISGLPYAPAARTRGGQEGFEQTERERAKLILLNAASEHPGPASDHALGKLYLAERDFNQAVIQFEKALKADPDNAQLHSDYGVALLELGKSAQMKGEPGRGLEYFAQGLEHLDRALELSPSIFEALFNRALCVQRMGLQQQAIEAWKNYLEKDPSSKWAEEARQNLNLLEGRGQKSSQSREQIFQDFLHAYKAKDDVQAWKLLNQNRDMVGNFIENRLIDEHLDLATKGRNAEADERFDLLSYAGNLEYHQADDRFIYDLTRFYRTATPAQRKNILQARSLMKSGHESFYNNNFDEALKLYSRAKEIFEREGDICEAIYISYPTGYCYLRLLKSEPGLAIFNSLAQSYERLQYKRLLAQTFSAMAYANQDLRDFSTAITNTTRSLKISEGIGDTIGFADSIFQLAGEYGFVSNYRRSLDLHAQALSQALTCLSQPTQLWRNFFSISLTLDQLGLYAAAITYQKEALQLAIEGERPRLACRSYTNLGQMLAKRGGYVEAVNNIERALEIGNSFPERNARIETSAYSYLQLGYVYRQSRDFNKAIESYDRAIQIYNELDSNLFNYMVWKDKLLCCLELGECPSVERDLEMLLEKIEQHRSKILEESNRNAFFDAEQGIYDVAIEFEYSKKGDPGKAFDYSERSRARSLRDLISTKIKVAGSRENPDIRFDDVSQPLGLEEIRARMPEQTQILQYAILKNSLLIWVLSRDGFSSASQRVSVEELNERVRGYIQIISDPSENSIEATSREAVYLYDLLIRPVEGALDKSKQLCIVPDKILNYLPFGALVSAPGKYFIEQHSFVLSPSSNIFILCSEAAHEKGGAKDETLLSVGNPSFDGSLFPDLADLFWAAKEAEAITGYYGSPGPIVGTDATERRVKSEMEKADVIHLATHAIADEWNPMRSKLLLAKEAGSNGVLQAHEIYNLNLARARLVVLSACRTGVEKYYGGEGMIGLSRPFIAKRIPLVVASLWSVNSDSTARLMTSFHRHRKIERMSTAEALRMAQLEMLRDAGSINRLPYNWASFVTIGGYAGF
jgi:CHAT domain-containing protein/tetratricopeptide (TPR) repeat protein